MDMEVTNLISLS